MSKEKKNRSGGKESLDAKVHQAQHKYGERIRIQGRQSVLNTIVVDSNRTRKGEVACIVKSENKKKHCRRKKKNAPEVRVGCDVEINRGDKDMRR